MNSNGTNKSYQACSIILLKIDFESIINLGGENTHHFIPPLSLPMVAGVVPRCRNRTLTASGVSLDGLDTQSSKP